MRPYGGRGRGDFHQLDACGVFHAPINEEHSYPTDQRLSTIQSDVPRLSRLRKECLTFSKNTNPLRLSYLKKAVKEH